MTSQVERILVSLSFVLILEAVRAELAGILFLEFVDTVVIVSMTSCKKMSVIGAIREAALQRFFLLAMHARRRVRWHGNASSDCKVLCLCDVRPGQVIARSLAGGIRSSLSSVIGGERCRGLAHTVVPLRCRTSSASWGNIRKCMHRLSGQRLNSGVIGGCCPWTSSEHREDVRCRRGLAGGGAVSITSHAG